MKLTTTLRAAVLLIPCLLIALLVRGQTFPDASVYSNDPAAMIGAPIRAPNGQITSTPSRLSATLLGAHEAISQPGRCCAT